MNEKELEGKFQEDFQLIFNSKYIDSASYRHDFSIYKAGYERGLKEISDRMNQKAEEALGRIEITNYGFKVNQRLDTIKKNFNNYLSMFKRK